MLGYKNEDMNTVYCDKDIDTIKDTVICLIEDMSSYVRLIPIDRAYYLDTRINTKKRCSLLSLKKKLGWGIVFYIEKEKPSIHVSTRVVYVKDIEIKIKLGMRSRRWRRR